MPQAQTGQVNAGNLWRRIPNGTRVRLRENTLEGVIDGLTELVVGPGRNPDGRTQYRINLGDPDRMLVAEDALLIIVDAEGLVLMRKEKVDYRRLVTEQLRGGFSADRFVRIGYMAGHKPARGVEGAAL